MSKSINMTIQSLLLDANLFREVLTGDITATIRIGDRPNITEGSLLLIDPTGRYLPVMVHATSIVTKTYGEITEADAVAMGSTNIDAAKALLRLFYPAVKDATPMTVISFTRA